MMCAQGGTAHCGKGMVFSLNPTPERSHADFQKLAIQKFGNGGGSAITGNGGEEEEAAAPEASSAAPAEPAAATGVVQGVGEIMPDGSCVCSVMCGTGSFPDPAAQGVGAYGGMGGSIDMEMVMPKEA